MDPLRNERGTMMLLLIVSIALMVSLGVGMSLLVSSSTFNELNMNNFNRAHYLAESGLRCGLTLSDTASGGLTYSLKDGEKINIQVSANGTQITSTGIVNEGTEFEARRTLVYSAGVVDDKPDANIPVISETFSDNLAALDTSQAGGRVSRQEFTTTEGNHSAFVAFNNVGGSNAVRDPEGTGCYIGVLTVPVASSVASKLRDAWNTYSRLSYDVQVKVGWDADLDAAAQGINFRWHPHPTYTTKYQGYGISFMRFLSRTSCNSNNSDDIPQNIKPGNGNSLAGDLLLVLWRQRVVNNVETRDWLAYAVLGDPYGNVRSMQDPKVVGNQYWPDGLVNDNATIGVRVEDKILSNGQRANEIKLFYGDAAPSYEPDYSRNPRIYTSPTTRGADAVMRNATRQRYPPEWVDSSLFPSWPSNEFKKNSGGITTEWSATAWQKKTKYAVGSIVIPTVSNSHYYKCIAVSGLSSTSGSVEPSWPAGSGRTVVDGGVTWRESGSESSVATGYDYFTVVSSSGYSPPSTPVTLVMNGDVTDVDLLDDGCTVRTYEFQLDSFPATRREVALHAMGDIEDGFFSSTSVAFDDLAIQILGKIEK